MDTLGLPRRISAYTMPGFATSQRTKDNAWRLIKALGVYGEELDIRPSSRQMLADIGHPAAHGENCYDTTYENVQAGQRTSILFAWPICTAVWCWVQVISASWLRLADIWRR